MTPPAPTPGPTGETVPGPSFAPRTYAVTRADLVAYAAASGDHNPIHQDESVALAVGLPGVIAHGMYTLALVGRYVDESVGRTGTIAEIGARFVKPVVVPPEGTEVTFEAVPRTLEDGTWRLDVQAMCAGVKVLAGCRVVLRD